MSKKKRLTRTVEETARLFGVGRNTGYEAVNKGEWPGIRVGRRWVIPNSFIEGQLGKKLDDEEIA